MDIKQFSSRVTQLMPSLVKGLVRQEHDCLTVDNITMPQVWVLEYLSHKGVSRMSDIAGFFNTSRPATTGIVERLIAQRLVRRQYITDDRRCVMIAISPKGKATIRNIREQKKRMLTHMFSRISSEKRVQYLRILEEIAKILNTPDGRK